MGMLSTRRFSSGTPKSSSRLVLANTKTLASPRSASSALALQQFTTAKSSGGRGGIGAASGLDGTARASGSDDESKCDCDALIKDWIQNCPSGEGEVNCKECYTTCTG